MRAMMLTALLVAACAGKSATSGEPHETDGDTSASGAMPGSGAGRAGEASGGTAGVPNGGGMGGTYRGSCSGIPGAQPCSIAGGGIGGTGVGGSIGGTAPIYGGAPATNPLIKGPDVCPDFATLLDTACPGPDVACVYQGLPAGPYPPTNPFRCSCAPETGWECANSDEQGETNCPTRFDQPCDPRLGQTACTRIINFAMGTCGCSCQGSDEGDGGAAGAPSGAWFCAC